MPFSYSVNHLKTWGKCRKKYELDVVRQLRWPSNPKNFRLGKGVHQLLDYTAKGLDVAPLYPGLDPDIAETWQCLQVSSWAKLPLVASEWGFSLETAGRWIYGRIDRIVQDNQQVLILDWKTGTGIPLDAQHDWQTQIYLYAVYQAQRDLGLTIDYEDLAFVYVQVKRGQLSEVRIDYSQQQYQQTAQRLEETFEQIETCTRYALPPACPDRFCPYLNICGIQTHTISQSHRIPSDSPQVLLDDLVF